MAVDILNILLNPIQWHESPPFYEWHKCVHVCVDQIGQTDPHIYGCEPRTLTQTMDGTSTRILCKILNVLWRIHITNQELISMRQSHLRLAGHNEVAVFLWKLSENSSPK